MTIDWTQPVETTEDPPRPVRVLATDRIGSFPVVIMFKNGDICSVHIEGWGSNGLRLRNIAPPKPEPVLIEGWVNFVRASTAYEGGTFWVVRNGAVWSTREWALIEAEKMRDVIGTAYIRVMSDGRPVPGEEKGLAGTFALKLNKMTTDRDAWRTKAEALQAEVERMKPFNRDVEVLCHQHGLEKVGLQVQIEQLQAEVADLQRGELGCSGCAWVDAVDAMRTVVDAAVAFCSATEAIPLRKVVRAYQQSPKKSAAEAVANVAAMIGTVKNCETCRWDRADHPCCGCRDNDFWEPRHD